MGEVPVNRNVRNREAESKPTARFPSNPHLSWFAGFGIFEGIFTPEYTYIFSLMYILTHIYYFLFRQLLLNERNKRGACWVFLTEIFKECSLFAFGCVLARQLQAIKTAELGHVLPQNALAVSCLFGTQRRHCGDHLILRSHLRTAKHNSDESDFKRNSFKSDYFFFETIIY